MMRALKLQKLAKRHISNSICFNFAKGLWLYFQYKHVHSTSSSVVPEEVGHAISATKILLLIVLFQVVFPVLEINRQKWREIVSEQRHI